MDQLSPEGQREVARLVDDAPPLTAEQQALLRMLLRPVIPTSPKENPNE